LQELDWAKEHSLLVYGSAANALATSDSSDLDLSLIIHNINYSSRSFLDIKKIKEIISVIKFYLEE